MWKLSATKPLKNGWDGKFYVFFLTIIKKKKQHLWNNIPRETFIVLNDCIRKEEFEKWSGNHCIDSSKRYEDKD